PGWEEDYHDRPAIHPVACLGRIFNEQRLPDGRWNLLLHGLRRIRIVEEAPPSQLYRLARVQLLEDVPPPGGEEEQQLRTELTGVLPPLLAAHGGAADQAQKLLESELSLGTLCDIFAFALPLETSLKQQLLEELDVIHRANCLLEHL